MKYIKTYKMKLVARNRTQSIVALVVVLVVAGAGAYLLESSHALSPYVANRAESGTVTAMASVQTCAGSTDGTCVQFGSTINPAPTGPAAPPSGWHVDLADDFNAPLGTGPGEDNLWYPNESWESDPTVNSNNDQCLQTQVDNSSEVSVANGMLNLSAKYEDDVAPAISNTCSAQRNYVAGIVTSSGPAGNTTYKGFTWNPGDGESTWAFEIVSKWPSASPGMWPSFYSSSQSTWTNERDFYEGYDMNHPDLNIDSDWIYQTSSSPNGFAQDWYKNQTTFDPSAAFHRYTYVVYPDQSWSFYIDGVLQTWVGDNGVASSRTGDHLPMDLLINYALRTDTTTPWTDAGIRTYSIKSVAVYQDEANAGQSMTGGGIAPGTVVGN
jgi:hypothetical protein